MAVPYSVDEDFRTIDGLELVTFRNPDPDTGSGGDQVNSVRAWRVVRTTDVVSPGDDGEMPRERIRWHLEAAGLTDKMKRRATIQGTDGVLWVVDTFRLVVFGTLYECECVRD